MELTQNERARMTLEQFYKEYTEWSIGTFGLDTPVHGAKKLQEEAKEIEADPYDIVEYSDALMCVLYGFKCAFPDKEISELIDVAHKKLQVNKASEWIKQPDGTWKRKKTDLNIAKKEGE